MANHKATQKDACARQQSAEKETVIMAKLRAMPFVISVTITDEAAYNEKLPLTISMIDKLAKKGIIHKNKAS